MLPETRQRKQVCTTKENEMKKTFEVEYRRTSYITVTVEAENEDDAETLAWQKINYDPVNECASWDIESIEVINQGESK